MTVKCGRCIVMGVERHQKALVPPVFSLKSVRKVRRNRGLELHPFMNLRVEGAQFPRMQQVPRRLTAFLWSHECRSKMIFGF